MRHALVLLLAVVFSMLGTTATAAGFGGPLLGSQVSVTADDTPGSADVVRTATPAGPHAAPTGPLAAIADPVPIPRPLPEATGPEPTAAAARAGAGSTTHGRAPPGATR